MRKPPDILPPEILTYQPLDLIEQTREYQLITPLYGGGVTPGEADPVTIIRATEVRGHLRFWWRACRGGLYGDSGKLKTAEDAIWGKAYKKGDPVVPQEHLIQIIVEQLKQKKPGDELEPFKIEKDNHNNNISKYDRKTDIPAYAAFPLQHSEEERRQQHPSRKIVLDNVAFRLTILFPSHHRDDVTAALWAWETFGGIGARTRRGFGALRCLSLQENQQPLVLDLPLDEQQQARKWIEEKLLTHVVDGLWAKTVPHLQKQAMAFEVVTRWGTHNQWTIWNNLIDTLKNFRQSRFPSTKQNAKHPGRSGWPEPSGIRKWTGQALIGHTKPIPNPHINKFPRAAFGLPIIFQFKDRNKYRPADKQSDPRKTVLQLAEAERFASPLILKPLACQNKAFIGLVLLLEGSRVEDFQLLLKTQERPDDEVNVESALEASESLVITGGSSSSPIRVDSQTNALQAFLKYLRSTTK